MLTFCRAKSKGVVRERKKDSERGTLTFYRVQSERELRTTKDSRRTRVTGASRSVGPGGRVSPGQRDTASERGTLTICGAQRERQIRTAKKAVSKRNSRPVERRGSNESGQVKKARECEEHSILPGAEGETCQEF
jgi:hypothetical protein